MKTRQILPAFLAATLILAGAAALRAEPADHPHPERHEELLKRFDKNGDGQLDEAEKAAAKEAARAARHEELLKRFDKDGDGKLNDAEKAEAKKFREEMKEKHRERRGEKLKRFDKDGDGKLSDAEKAEARKAWDERKSEKAGPAPE